MNRYKVIFENNIAVSAMPANELQHGDIGFSKNKSIEWFAIECEDDKMAIEIANKVVGMIWGEKKD